VSRLEFRSAGASSRLILRTLLGQYPNTRALKDGTITSPLVDLHFDNVPVPNRAFKGVVRGLEYDVAELAVMTFLMARDGGAPLVLLPVVIFSRNPLTYLVTRVGGGIDSPADLHGRRVGVRSFTTTTAVWVRALLTHECGVNVDRIRWLTWEEGHVANVPDPPTATRVIGDASLATMLLSGELDAAIVDPIPADPRVRPVVADADGVYARWCQRHDARALNHMVVLRTSLCDAHPEAVREVFRLLASSREAADDSFDRTSAPLGVGANRHSLERAVAYASEQGLVARPMPVETLFSPETAALNWTARMD
jgi:4,5-dihydroxyphthalate decarboxylase